MDALSAALRTLIDAYRVERNVLAESIAVPHRGTASPAAAPPIGPLDDAERELLAEMDRHLADATAALEAHGR